MTNTGDPVSIGELSRRMDRFELAIAADLAEERQARAAVAASSVEKGTYEANRKADLDALANVRAEQQAQAGRISWAWRTAITAFAGPIVVALVVFLMRGGA